MKKIILGLMIFLTTSLFATDVSDFDIKGIKLGISKNEVLEKMQNISSYSLEKKVPIYIGEIITGFQLTYNDKNDGFFMFDFDKNQTLYRIQREIKLKKMANINKIFNQIYSKYGRPKDTWKNSSLLQICYGKCRRGEYYFEPIKNQKCFSIAFFKSDNSLDFIMKDDSIYEANQIYKNRIKRKLYNQEKQNASHIDL